MVPVFNEAAALLDIQKANPLRVRACREVYRREWYSTSGAAFAYWGGEEGKAMYHLIEFNTDFTADLEVSPKQRLERLRVRKGTRACVYLRPHVVETAEGPVEVADLFFEDGTTTRQVPFGRFRFV